MEDSGAGSSEYQWRIQSKELGGSVTGFRAQPGYVEVIEIRTDDDELLAQVAFDYHHLTAFRRQLQKIEKDLEHERLTIPRTLRSFHDVERSRRWRKLGQD